MSIEQKGSGIKLSLENIDHDLTDVNKEMKDNYVKFLTLKNYQEKLNTIFNIRVEETERNFKQEMDKFEQEIGVSFRNHVSVTKMLDRKIDQIRQSQEELASNLFFIEEKVKDIEAAIG